MKTAAGIVCLVIAATVILAWLTGAAVSDRWWWSQWLLWIPALSLAPAGLLAWAGMALCGLRPMATGPLIALAGLVIFLWTHWSPGALPAQEGIRILQWSAGPAMQAREQFSQFVADVDPDVAIVHGDRRLGGTRTLQDWLARTGASLASRGEFTIASKLPIVRFRIVAWAQHVVLATCDLDVGTAEPLRLLLVDLPSDPHRRRGEIIDAAHVLLDKVPEPPDLIIGDFNLTERSWQLGRFMPGWTPAWRDSGVGWGGTFPRRLPLYRIDHVLVAPDMRLEGITTADPGMGRHRAQLIVLPGQPTSLENQSSLPLSPSSQ